ncbi:MAG TPA: glycosyltransferase family 39 protein [Hyphomonadaceae bacterium]|nr:glycosyltransferase family 39 protein [Hyphomonadaceae bacterium]
MKALTDLWRHKPAAAAAVCIAALVALRLIVVVASPLEIGPDEAQYWRWSRTLDFGYYSKPPLIAWIIALSTGVFGNGEWAIRFFAPILHGVAAWFLFLLGRRAFDNRIGAWAAAIYLLMPGVWLSSTIMSTDAVLLPAWAAALYFLWRLREQPKISNGALAGAAIGLAMLAKYAALYLFVGAGLAALFDRDMRRAIFSPAGVAAGIAALLVLSPNLLWNAANGFATVSHTADNANLGEAGFNPLHVFGFIGDQMAVFGPVTLVALFAGFGLIAGRKDKETTTRELWLLCFIVPPLVVILGQEIMSRAHANWAATAYPAACVLLASWIDRAFLGESRAKAAPFVKGGIGLNAVIGVLFAIVWVAPALGDALGAANAFKRVRGWEQTADDLGALALEHSATALMFDEREVWHGVDYYGRDKPLPPIRAWRRTDHPRSHAEEAGAMQPGEDGRVIIASVRPDFRPRIRADFEAIEPLGTLTVPLGPKRSRQLKLYIASGYHPLARTAEYEARFAGQKED